MCVAVKINPSAGSGVAHCLVDVSLHRNPCGPTPRVTQGDAELSDGQLSLCASQLVLHMLFRLRDQDLVAPHGMNIFFSGLHAEKGWSRLA